MIVRVGGIGVDERLGARWLLVVGPAGTVGKLFVGSDQERARAAPLVGSAYEVDSCEPGDVIELEPVTPYVATIKIVSPPLPGTGTN